MAKKTYFDLGAARYQSLQFSAADLQDADDLRLRASAQQLAETIQLEIDRLFLHAHAMPPKQPRPGSTLQLNQPLSAATLGQPTKYQFCPHCGLDVFSNPGAKVLDIPVDPRDNVRVLCDCGEYCYVPKWLFK